jgi:hypothetical protein
MVDSSVDYRQGQLVPVRWSQSQLRELQSQVDEPAAGARAVVSVFAKAQILAANGDFESAVATAVAALDTESQILYDDWHIFHAALMTMFVIQRFDLAAILIERQYKSGCPIELKLSSIGYNRQVVLWELDLPSRMSFTFDVSILQHDRTTIDVMYFGWILPLCTRFSRQPGTWRGSLVINQGDVGTLPGLAFCDSRPEYFLVPDNVFIPNWGYERARLHFSQNRPQWEDRKDVALWRGGTTGQVTDAKLGWKSLQRIRLCEIAKDYPDLIDAGITNVVQIGDSAAKQALQDAGLLRSPIPSSDFDQYKYQIDIDGNTNAWSGLFQKLLTGSPVLKVASPFGYRQWYYDRLKPWVNYVPVLADMSDLIEKIHWLREHDEVARAIGKGGRDLALSMDYDTEMDGAMRTVAAALRYFSQAPEQVKSSGVTADENAREQDGSIEPQQGDVPAYGCDSQTQQPASPTSGTESSRPVALGATQTKGRTEMEAQIGDSHDAQEVVSQFESLGGSTHGSEFGVFQRHFGADPLGLLSWADIEHHRLTQALMNRFAGVGEPDHTEIFQGSNDDRNEWWSRVKRYSMAMPGFLAVDEVQFDQAKDLILKRLTNLRDKLLSDLAAAEKIFVYKSTSRNLTHHELAALYSAVRTYGDNTLLYLRHADQDHPHESVTRLAPSLLVGALAHFSNSPTNEPLEPPNESVLAICRTALRLWRDPAAGTPDPEASQFHLAFIDCSLQGHVDIATSTFLAGWAVDITRPNEPTDISILVDGKELAQVACDDLRADLAGRHGHGNGRHGFHYSPETPLAGPAAKRITFRYAGTLRLLGRGEVVLDADTIEPSQHSGTEPQPALVAEPPSHLVTEPQPDLVDEPTPSLVAEPLAQLHRAPVAEPPSQPLVPLSLYDQFQTLYNRLRQTWRRFT